MIEETGAARREEAAGQGRSAAASERARERRVWLAVQGSIRLPSPPPPPPSLRVRSNARDGDTDAHSNTPFTACSHSVSHRSWD